MFAREMYLIICACYQAKTAQIWKQICLYETLKADKYKFSFPSGIVPLKLELKN